MLQKSFFMKSLFLLPYRESFWETIAALLVYPYCNFFLYFCWGVCQP